MSNLLSPTWLKQNLRLKVSATDCAHTKSWDIFLDGHNRFIKIGNISATRSHAQVIFHKVSKTLCCIFRTGLRLLSVTAMGENEYSNPQLATTNGL